MPVVVGVGILVLFWTGQSLVTVIFLLGMLFVFLYYWLIVPFAVLQKLRQDVGGASLESYPPISLLIPAYNEEGYLNLTLDSIAAADYPAPLELIASTTAASTGPPRRPAPTRGRTRPSSGRTTAGSTPR